MTATDTFEESLNISPGELAHDLESLPPTERADLWRGLSAEERSATMPFLHDEIKEGLIETASVVELQNMTENMAASDVAHVIETVSNDVAQDIVDNLSDEAREYVQESLSFDENQIGRWLRHDDLRFLESESVAKVMKRLKVCGLPKYTDKIFLVSRDASYQGAVSLSSILEADETQLLVELTKVESDCTFDPEIMISEMATEFRKNHFISAAVVSRDGFLLGRITSEDAVTTLQDEADHQLMSMAGLDEEDDLFAPIGVSAKRRALWLGINLLTAFLASYVIGIFEATVQQLVALAVLMPIVASMGGIAGSQTLTIVIRGLALDKLNDSNTRTLLVKELGVGVLNGILWATVVGLVAYAWFGNQTLGMVIAAAILVNLIAAAFAGMLIPLALDRLKLDPALSGSVVLTTVTDIIGFMSFLGLATLFLV
ncbi:MAG: magnesium transporter [Chitinophagales bacterium]|jgi:magnesium transporter